MKKLLFLILFPALLFAQTRNIVPRAAGQGGIGTAAKPWATSYFDTVNVLGPLFWNGKANITGTLTLGDANGFGSTFYAGLVQKNLLPYSQGAFNSWTDNGSTGLTITDGGFTAPDSTLTASRWVETSGTYPWKYWNTTTPTQGRTFTFSVWLRGNTGGESVALSIARWTDYVVIQSITFILTNKWERYVITGTDNNAHPTYTVYATIATNDSNETVYVWGAQLELGSSATPYQPTDGTLSTSTGYGMWSVAGGFGGTMQNPVVPMSPAGLYVRDAGSTYYTSTPYNGTFIGNWTPSATFSGVLLNQDGFYGYQSGTEVMKMDNTGVLFNGWTMDSTSAPDSSISNATQVWAQDVNGVAGTVSLHERTEDANSATASENDQVIVSAVIKATTGDPSYGHEGLVCINTYDHTVKIYAGGGWRVVVATW